jgi:hypothetical protein
MKKRLFVILITTTLIMSGCLLNCNPICGKEKILIENLINTKYRTYTKINPEDMFGYCFISGWPQVFDNGPEDSSSAVAIDSNDNIIVTGYTANEVDERLNFLTIKYDSEGNEIWNVTYDSGMWDFAWDISVDSLDNIIVFGINYSTRDDILNHDFRIVKYNENGVEQWNVSIAGKKENYPGGIAVDSNDNIVLTVGQGDLDDLDFKCWTVKLDNNGQEIWNKTYDDDVISFGADVVVNQNDDIFVGGMAASYFNQGYFVVKYDSDGNKKRLNRYGGTQLNAMAIDNEDQLVLTGMGFSRMTNSSFWYTIKCDENGEMLWDQIFDTINPEYGTDIDIDSNGNIITVGSMFFGETKVEQCSIIYDKNGMELCIKKPGIEGALSGVVIDSNDRIIVSGSIGDPYNWDYYTDIFNDITPPSVELQRPKAGYLYIFDKEIMPLFENAIIFGKIEVVLSVDNPSDVEKVEFYVDKELIKTIYESPYEWTWSELSFGKHTLETMTYDSVGNINRNEIIAWKIL